MKNLQSIMTISLTIVLLLLCSSAVNAYKENDEKGKDKKVENCAPKQYVFTWNMSDSCLPKPRGGSTAGVPVTLTASPSVQWQSLQEPTLSKFERDRRAILAMAGGYRASFEFLETVGFTPGFEPAQPYHSWGTEYIFVVEDRKDFISLQHIMVMFFQEGDEVSGPMVMKHWRQDWHFEDRELLEYTGNLGWQKRELSKKEVKGTWSQSVYQVDDSPRYASYGKWRHTDDFSSWQSDITWRPLPRREHSVRDDYHVLEGTNRHTILPTGWVQEEENLKLRLDEQAEPDGYLAKELGNNRYQLVKDFDFSSGEKYWNETGPYWEIVRRSWDVLFAKENRFILHTGKDGKPLFMVLFGLADAFRKGEISEKEVREKVDETLLEYWQKKDG